MQSHGGCPLGRISKLHLNPNQLRLDDDRQVATGACHIFREQLGWVSGVCDMSSSSMAFTLAMHSADFLNVAPFVCVSAHVRRYVYV